METTISYDGRAYTITDGVVTSGKLRIESEGYRPIPAPREYHAAMRAKGIVVEEYCYWGGKLLAAVVADEAQRQLDEMEGAKYAGIPGLDELRTAIHAQVAYDEAMADAIHRGDSRYAAPLDVDVAALKRQYPVAAAYLDAEAASQSGHHTHRAAGLRAMARIKAGENHEAVLADMEAEWSGYVLAHQWD